METLGYGSGQSIFIYPSEGRIAIEGLPEIGIDDEDAPRTPRTATNDLVKTLDATRDSGAASDHPI